MGNNKQIKELENLIIELGQSKQCHFHVLRVGLVSEEVKRINLDIIVLCRTIILS